MIEGAFQKRIIGFMGNDGRDWIDGLEEKIRFVEDAYGIRYVKAFDLSYNYVYLGQADQDYVVKLCLPGPEFVTEYRSLQELNDMVKLEHYHEEKNIIVLQAIKPGQTLWTLPFSEALNIGCDLIKRTPSKSYKHKYPKYLDWLLKVKAHIEKNYPSHDILKHLDYTVKIYDSLKVMGNDMLLLHGDLHHGNILKGDRWTVIDPKGVMGHRSLEVGRFMLNQVHHDHGFKNLEAMVDAFSKSLNLKRDIILKSFYMDMVLSTSWFLEDDDVNHQMIDIRLEQMEHLKEKL